MYIDRNKRLAFDFLQSRLQLNGKFGISFPGRLNRNKVFSIIKPLIWWVFNNILSPNIHMLTSIILVNLDCWFS